MKSQEEELKRRIAILVAEGETEKAKVVDDLFQVSGSSKGSIQSELRPPTQITLFPLKNMSNWAPNANPNTSVEIIPNQQWIQKFVLGTQVLLMTAAVMKAELVRNSFSKC